MPLPHHTYILHNPHRLLRLPHELILLVLDLGALLGADLLLVRIHALAGRILRFPFRRIQAESCILHRAPGPRRELDVRIQRRAPPGQELVLDAGILCQTRLAHFLLGQSVFLQCRSKRLFGRTRVRGVQGLRPRERGAGDGVVEGFGLRLCGGWGGEGGLGFGRRRGVGEEGYFFRDGAAEVVEGLGDVGRVVVGFFGVLGTAKSRKGGC